MVYRSTKVPERRKMYVNGVDKEGNLYLSCDVTVLCHGKSVLILGTGSKAVIKFYNIAEKGIPGAKATVF